MAKTHESHQVSILAASIAGVACLIDDQLVLTVPEVVSHFGL